jgi:hypothetical protein
MDRLNSILETLGGDALRHRMELVERSHVFFITCRNSPRFNWKTHLTHLEVGRNLDFVAAGHIFYSPQPARGSNLFFERSSMELVVVENVLLESLEDEDVKREMMEFNLAKEKLFNEVMDKFGLEYRFKWFLVTPSLAIGAAIVLENETPPSAGWWDENCIFASGSGRVAGELTTPRFISFNVKFAPYWSLIRHMYSFVLQYESVIYPDLNNYLHGMSDLWDSVRQLYDECELLWKRQCQRMSLRNLWSM